MKRTGRSALVGAAAALLTGFALVGPAIGAHADSSSAGAPVYGGTLTLDLQQNFPSLDPAIAYDPISYTAVEEMFDELVTYKGATNDLQPDLATWTISDGGKVYTFHIKSATFWNGAPVTANSFIYEFERVLSPKVNSPGQGFIEDLIAGAKAYATNKAKSVAGLDAVSADTLRVTLTHPDATFLYIAAMPFFAAVDPAYEAAHSLAYLTQHPMGTGPFELLSYRPGVQAVLVRNPHYFVPGIPYLNKVVFNVDGSPSSVLYHFEQGLTGMISQNQTGIPAADYLPLSTNPKFSKDIVKQAQVTTNYLGLNAKYGPTKSVAVRRALEYAVNKSFLVRIMDGLALPANQVIPPSMPSGYESVLPADATYSYDPAEARRLLAKAGYPKGFSTNLYCYNNPTSYNTAVALQQMFANVGVKVKVVSTNLNVFVNQIQTGKSSMFLSSWGEDYPDPSDFLNSLFNSTNIPDVDNSSYSNPTVDRLLNQAALMPAGTARDNVYKQVQNIVMSQAAWIPTTWPVYAAAVQPWLKGFYINPNLTDPLRYMWIAKH